MEVSAQAVERQPSVVAGGGGLRLEYGKKDARGCRRLVVYSGDRRVIKIPSHQAACSRVHKRKPVFSRLYFGWTVVRTSGQGPNTKTTQRSDLWVTDGTRAGTVKVTTLRESLGRGLDTCDSRWARAGYRAIAGAQWCQERRTGDWVSGRIAIILGDRVVRYLPVPRMLHFRMAARRIVTTGEDGRGRELWVHDDQMTRVDLRAGPIGSNPRQLEDLGPRVRFIANDGGGKAV